MKRSLAVLAALLVLPLSFLACGETEETPDGGTDAGGPDPVIVDISGVAAVHPVSDGIDFALSGGTAHPTLTGATLTLEDPILRLAGRDATLKHEDGSAATMALTPNTGAEGTANFAFTAVDTSDITLGLIGTMTGTTLVKTAMGIHGGPLTENKTDARAFGVTLTSEGAMAALAGKNPGELTSAGWILGTFVNAAGAPVDGVKLVKKSDGSDVPNVIYPVADFTGVETDGNTSANGVFFLTDLALTEVTGSGGCDAPNAWSSQSAATSPDAVFVMFPTCAAP